MASRTRHVALKHWARGDCVICCCFLCFQGMGHADGDSAMVAIPLALLRCPLHCWHAQSSRPILFSKEGMASLMQDLGGKGLKDARTVQWSRWHHASQGRVWR